MTYRALGLGDSAHEADRGHEGQGNGEGLHCIGYWLMVVKVLHKKQLAAESKRPQEEKNELDWRAEKDQEKNSGGGSEVKKGPGPVPVVREAQRG